VTDDLTDVYLLVPLFWPDGPLKVHKIEIFLASILKFVIFLYELCQNIKIFQKKFFDWASIGGCTIFPRSLKTTRNEKKILS
jgi:hypothetical protein